MAGPDDSSPPRPPKPPAAPGVGSAPTPWPIAALDPDYPDPEGLVLSGATLDFGRARTVSVLRSRLEGGGIVCDGETPLDLCDCVLDGVDLHGLRLVGLTRVTMTRCRLTGADLGDATLRDVVFDDCALDLSSMRAATIERALVAGGRVDGLDLTRARLTDVTVQGIRLAEVTTTGIWCVRVDLTGAELLGIDDLTVLRGCTIGAEQAIALSLRLARGLGIHVDT